MAKEPEKKKFGEREEAAAKAIAKAVGEWRYHQGEISLRPPQEGIDASSPDPDPPQESDGKGLERYRRRPLGDRAITEFVKVMLLEAGEISRGEPMLESPTRRSRGRPRNDRVHLLRVSLEVHWENYFGPREKNDKLAAQAINRVWEVVREYMGRPVVNARDGAHAALDAITPSAEHIEKLLFPEELQALDLPDDL